MFLCNPVSPGFDIIISRSVSIPSFRFGEEARHKYADRYTHFFRSTWPVKHMKAFFSIKHIIKHMKAFVEKNKHMIKHIRVLTCNSLG